jgi:hypothetical protein
MPQVTKYVKTLTKAQQIALKRVYDRGADSTKDLSYRQFRKTVCHSFDCSMVQWAGMWLGIELDGYTHS